MQKPGNAAPVVTANTTSFRPIDNLSRAEIVAEFNFRHGQFDTFKPIIERHLKLRETILGWYPALDAAASVEVNEGGYRVLITAADNQKKVSIQGMRKLVKLLGMTEFFRRSTFALKQLPADGDQSLFAVQERTGPRHLKPLPALLDQAA